MLHRYLFNINWSDVLNFRTSHVSCNGFLCVSEILDGELSYGILYVCSCGLLSRTWHSHWCRWLKYHETSITILLLPWTPRLCPVSCFLLSPAEMKAADLHWSTKQTRLTFYVHKFTDFWFFYVPAVFQAPLIWYFIHLQYIFQLSGCNKAVNWCRVLHTQIDLVHPVVICKL